MRIICLIILSLVSFVSFSQEHVQMESKYFIVLYTTGDHWDPGKQANEQLYFNEHSAHLKALRKEGKVFIGGRYAETGMLIIKAEDEVQAKALITSDISVRSKIFNAEISPFSPFYKGCIE